MAYDVRFNVSQTGAETIDQITGKLVVMKTQVSAVASEMTQAAKRVTDAENQMAAAVASGHGQLAATLSGIVAKERAELETLVAKHRELKAAVDEVTGAHTRMVPAVAAANAEFALMEGRLPTRALGQFATNVLGLGPILQMAFPIFGAVAFGEVLLNLVNKFTPVNNATKDLAKALADLDAKYKGAADSIERFKEAKDRADGKPSAGRADAAAYAGSERDLVAANIRRVQGQIDQIDRANGVGQKFGNAQLSVGPGEDFDRQQKLRVEKAELQQQLRVLDAGKSAATAESAHDKKNEDKTAARPGIEAANRRRELTARYGARADEAEGRDNNDPYAAIQSSIQGRINEDSKPGAPLSAEAMASAQRQAVAENTKASLKLMDANAKRLGELTAKVVSGVDTDQREQGNVSASEFRKSLAKDIAEGTKGVAADHASAKDLADSDASGVRRQLQATIRANSTRGGGPGGAQGAGADYAAQLTAAQQIFDIEDKRVKLYDNEDEKIRDNAANKKQLAESVYQAEAQYEESLDDLREKNLEKYHKDATSIFDALTNRQVGAGRALGMLLKKDALSEGGTLFGNVMGPMLQTAGQGIAGAIPGSWGKTLKGTMLDPSNKAVPNAAEAAVATNTSKANDWLEQIYKAISGDASATGDPASANPAALTNPMSGMASMAVASLPAAMSSGPLAGISKALGLAGGGIGSVFSGNALSTMLGLGTPGVNGQPGTAPTTGQQIGAGVGLAGTLAAGAYGIVSGIHAGGAGGALTAAGSAAGVAGALVGNVANLLQATGPLLSAIPIVGSIAALALPLIGSLFGNGPVQRANQINQELSANQYIAPQALNVTQSSNGNFTDFDARGNMRSSNFSAVPTVRQGSVWEQTHGLFGPPPTYYDVPGTQTGQFNAASAKPTTIINVSAMDSQSFSEFADKNHIAIGNAAARNLQNVHGALATEVQRTANG